MQNAGWFWSRGLISLPLKSDYAAQPTNLIIRASKPPSLPPSVSDFQNLQTLAHVKINWRRETCLRPWVNVLGIWNLLLFYSPKSSDFTGEEKWNPQPLNKEGTARRLVQLGGEGGRRINLSCQKLCDKMGGNVELGKFMHKTKQIPSHLILLIIPACSILVLQFPSHRCPITVKNWQDEISNWPFPKPSSLIASTYNPWIPS